MMPVRYLVLVALIMAIGVGVVSGQSRDHLDPATPQEQLVRVAGWLPSDSYTSADAWYQPRRYFNPLMQDPSLLPVGVRDAAGPGGFIGRSPFVAYAYDAAAPGTLDDNPGAIFEDDGELDIDPPDYTNGDAYTPVLDLDQYTMQVEFGTPSYVQVRNPDTGATERHWYLTYQVTNPNPYPIHGILDFDLRTEQQPVNADPYAAESGSTRQQEAIDEALREQFGLDQIAETELLA